MLVVSAGGGEVAQALLRGLAGVPGRKRHVALKGAPSVAIDGFESRRIGSASPADRQRALEGVSALVLLPTYDRSMAESQIALVAGAKAAGVSGIYMVSLAGADPVSPVTLLRWCGLVAREIQSSGLPHAIFACAPFLQNLPLFTERDGNGFAIVGPFRSARFPWIDARDVGEIVARMTQAQMVEPISCVLTGSDELDFTAICSKLEACLVRPVRFVDLLMPEAVGRLEALGLSAGRIRVITEYWDYLVSGVVGAERCTTAAQYLGHPLRTADGYLAELAQRLRDAA